MIRSGMIAPVPLRKEMIQPNLLFSGNTVAFVNPFKPVLLIMVNDLILQISKPTRSFLQPDPGNCLWLLRAEKKVS